MALLTPPGKPRLNAQPKALHYLRATPETCHWGYFSADLPPALTVESGDLVYAESISHHAGDAPHLMFDDAIREIYEKIPVEDRYPGVHLLTGPVYVKDAKPGDMLEVRYLQLSPRLNYGSNVAANWGHLFEEMDRKERVTIYEIDDDHQTCSALYAYDNTGGYDTPGDIYEIPEARREKALEGIRVPARLFAGTAGVAPDVAGRVDTIPPGLHGGNVDNQNMGAGTTMFYPVQVDGGLFSIGDSHFSQGDGEVSGAAIEASLNCLIQFTVRKDFHHPSPLLETPHHWIVHGFDEDLNQAMRNAAVDTQKLLQEQCGLSADDAYSLMSVACDFHITQVVDSVQGVHAKIPRSIFAAPGTVRDPS
ncbi:MAG: acetamidase/formamidase family protein [Pseudomonadota bacterium]